MYRRYETGKGQEVMVHACAQWTKENIKNAKKLLLKNQ
jgi:hypothetical protein